jgi:hypothetical protein
MKKKWVIGLTLVSVLAFFTANAYPWGAAVHVYVASMIKPPNPNIWYGAIAPDCFNYYFDDLTVKYTLLAQFHDYPIDLWNAAGDDPAKKALAFGFLCHGQTGGADTTAHLHGVQFGKKEGYVILKAKVLDNILTKFPEYRYLKAKYPAVSMEVAHNLLENGLDVLLKRIDPGIGEKIFVAALARADLFPDWLASVYAPPLSGLIYAVEDAFRGMMMLYGSMFFMTEPEIIYLLSQQMASFAPLFLPPDAQMTPERAFAIAKYGTEKAMEICADTFPVELEATIKFVNASLASFIF